MSKIIENKKEKKKSCFQITSVTQSSPEDVGEHQEGQLSITSPVNGGVSVKSTSSGRNTPRSARGSLPFVFSSSVITSAAAVLTSMGHTTPTSSCSSRFRVIKLDHSNGEPFRRGRWSCTEFYEKESDSGTHRTVESMKPSASFDHSGDRDSGYGATCNSVVTSSTFSAQGLENSTDSGYSGHHKLPQASESLQQNYGLAPQIGSGASDFQTTGYACTALQQTPQTPIADSLNDVHHGANMSAASHHHQFVYSPQASQIHLPNASPSVSSPPFPLAGPGTQGQGGDASSTPGFMQQVGNASAVAPVISGSAQQQPSGGASGAFAPSTTASQSVPTTVPSPTSMLSDASGEAPGAAALNQLQGAGGGVGHPTDDGRKTIEAVPLQSGSAGPQKDGVMSPIGESLRLTSPSVKNFFGIQITMNTDGDGASGANVVAIDNKIEQAMDLVKSHLMYAVREEVEVLKEQIKELYERNSVLERENAVLKSLANTQQLTQLSSQLSCLSPPLQLHQPPFIKNSGHSLVHHEGSQGVSYQPNITSA
ncbi:TSC22 domain family protein 2-like [Cyprinodon tularosa]|uniref:TSC22 domain family protein 2-like n=1 Tax=Cyprinodon tularosa TaxID=77115 RepID=UPI0018E25C8A|nr:TSC22 domain family protein 2-like [Cyprinodon tularosa]